MPTDRLSRSVWVCSLALALAPMTVGCRSTRSEVPPGKPFSSDGKAPQALNFGSSPSPRTGPINAAVPGNLGGPNSPYGTPPPGPNPYGGLNTGASGLSSMGSQPVAESTAPPGGAPAAKDPGGGNRWSSDPAQSGPTVPQTGLFN